MTNEIFEKINQIAILSNEYRLKILLALFNSEFEVNGKRVGSHSHTIEEIKNIVGGQEVSYHLQLLENSNLVEKDSKIDDLFHITEQGKKALKEFGISDKIVENAAKQIA